MGKKKKVNVHDVYDVQHYTWDGKDRPVIENYTQPWISYASQGSPSNMFYKKRHGAITYAQNQLKYAIDQYNADLDFWNEADSRQYNSPISQSSRFEDAGYNLGYLYSQVSSGNTSSGYNGAFSDSDPNDTTHMDNPFTVAMDVISGVASTLVSLLDSGVKAYEILSLTPGKKSSLFYDNSIKALESDWQSFISKYTVDDNGNIIRLTDSYGDPAQFGYGTTQSLKLSSFFADITGQTLSNKDLSTWLNYCDKIYRAQSAEDDTFIKDANKWVNDQDWNNFTKLLMKFFFNLSNNARVGATFTAPRSK